jgi:hypothetical protein
VKSIDFAFAGGSGWNVTVYVPASMGNFSDFPWNPSARQAVGNAFVPYLSLRDNFAEAFPGTPADDFALIATSNISVSAGSHQFCTTSHDGSWLFVDGSLLIRNDISSLYCSEYLRYGYYWYYWYCMNPSSACQHIQLSEGVHTITVNYLKQKVNHSGSLTALAVSMDGSLIILNGKAPCLCPLVLCLLLNHVPCIRRDRETA